MYFLAFRQTCKNNVLDVYLTMCIFMCVGVSLSVRMSVCLSLGMCVCVCVNACMWTNRASTVDSLAKSTCRAHALLCPSRRVHDCPLSPWPFRVALTSSCKVGQEAVVDFVKAAASVDASWSNIAPWSAWKGASLEPCSGLMLGRLVHT